MQTSVMQGSVLHEVLVLLFPPLQSPANAVTQATYYQPLPAPPAMAHHLPPPPDPGTMPLYYDFLTPPLHSPPPHSHPPPLPHSHPPPPPPQEIKSHTDNSICLVYTSDLGQCISYNIVQGRSLCALAANLNFWRKNLHECFCYTPKLQTMPSNAGIVVVWCVSTQAADSTTSPQKDLTVVADTTVPDNPHCEEEKGGPEERETASEGPQDDNPSVVSSTDATSTSVSSLSLDMGKCSLVEQEQGAAASVESVDEATTEEGGERETEHVEGTEESAPSQSKPVKTRPPNLPYLLQPPHHYQQQNYFTLATVHQCTS